MLDKLKEFQKYLGMNWGVIPSKYLHEDYMNTGVSCGKANSFGKEYNVASYIEGHLLCIGGSGKGKSSNVVLPTLWSYDEPIFAIDIKGELSKEYELRKANDKNSRPYIIFNPLDPNTYRYDPFYLIRESGPENVVQLITELAFSIIPDDVNVKDKFWINSERTLLIGFMLFYFKNGTTFSETMIIIQTHKMDKLINIILESDNTLAIMHIKDMQLSDPKLLASLSLGLSNKILVFSSDNAINDALSGSPNDENNFNWNMLETHNIFFTIPEHKISQWTNVISLMINQLFSTLERRPDNCNKQSHILLLLDELPRIGFINIVNAVSTLRSKHVTIASFIQSIAQLDMIYGEKARQTIVDNCNYQIFLGSQDPQTQQYMSSAVGEHTVTQRSHNLVENNITSSSITKINEPILQPHQFRNLNNIVLITPEDVYQVDFYPVWKKHVLERGSYD